MKNNRHGQAAIWTNTVINKMRLKLKVSRQRLIFEISLFTGERMGAIVQLEVKDVFDQNGEVLKYINFKGSSRKATKHGQAKTRQAFVHPILREQLINYERPQNGYLFPTNSTTGHISRRAVDKYWRGILAQYNFQGFSTHSSRRYVINKLRSNGVEIVTISEAMGMSVNVVRHYLDNDPIAVENAIATLAA